MQILHAHRPFRASFVLALALTLGACGTDDGPAGGNGSGGDDNGHQFPQTPSATAYTDPGCLDGQYAESAPDPSVDIGATIADFSSSDVDGYVDAILSLRFPTGAYLVQGGLQAQSIGHCIEFFLPNANSAQDVHDRISTIVHECGHFFDIDQSDFPASALVVNEGLRFDCEYGDTTERGGETFARSRILTDSYASLHPPCDGAATGSCDYYADAYLSGDPDDATFDSGDQGFNMLLEEAHQYVNGLAADYAFNDQLSFAATSSRDGVLVMLWYLQRYLRMARLDYPAAYEHLTTSACYREAILTVWARAWIYLTLTGDMSNLGIRDDFLEGLATDPDLLAEIEHIRDAEGCGGP